MAQPIQALLSPRLEKSNNFDLDHNATYPNEYGYTPGPQQSKKVYLFGKLEPREKILSLHKREMLKGLLINKFRLKYAQDQAKHPNLQNYINNEVLKFISSERLTEDNLKRLDDKIAREADTRDRKEAILEDRRSSIVPGSIFHQNRLNYLNSTGILPQADNNGTSTIDPPKSARFDRISHTSSQAFR